MDGHGTEQGRDNRDRSRPDADRYIDVNPGNDPVKPVMTGTFQLGQLANLVTNVAGLIGIIVTIVAVSTHVEAGLITQQNKLEDFKVSVTQQLGDIRSDLRNGLDAVHRQIVGVPEGVARLSAVERRLEEIDRSASGMSSRLEVVEQRSIQTQATLDNVVPSTRAKLGPRGQ